MKKIYITMGDPRGIGPEIILKSLKDILKINKKYDFVPVIIGDKNIIKDYAAKYSIDFYEAVNADYKSGRIYFINVETKNHPGYDSLNYIEKGVQLCRQDSQSAIVTAPVIKESIAQIRNDFTGHTEYLAKLMNVDRVVMSFISTGIKMSLLTTHLPLKEVSFQINAENISEHVKIIVVCLKRWFDISSPNIVLCSINPHAGEEGLLGNEEKEKIIPALKQLKKEGVNITGPLGAPEALKRTIDKEFDFIISAYHDQILTAVKVFLEPTVNLTMGLPIVRTSPDHGPALDMAGKERGDFRSMKSAIELAAELVK
jgi:4-hydroxythreonine-4-phosphate dehydrogenase